MSRRQQELLEKVRIKILQMRILLSADCGKAVLGKISPDPRRGFDVLIRASRL